MCSEETRQAIRRAMGLYVSMTEWCYCSDLQLEELARQRGYTRRTFPSLRPVPDKYPLAKAAWEEWNRNRPKDFRGPMYDRI